MMRIWKILLLCFLFSPLVVGAETITWVAPTTYTDGSTITAEKKATLRYYLRGYPEGKPGMKTYFLETRGGITTVTDNILVRMNQWGASKAGWVPLVVGDNVFITISTANPYIDNGVAKEIDGPESPPYRWTLPGAAPPTPPVVVPSCNPPTGISIR